MYVKISQLFLFYFLSFSIFLSTFCKNKLIEDTKNRKTNILGNFVVKGRHLPNRGRISNIRINIATRNYLNKTNAHKQRQLQICYCTGWSLFCSLNFSVNANICTWRNLPIQKKNFLNCINNIRYRFGGLKTNKRKNKNALYTSTKKNIIFSVNGTKENVSPWTHININTYINKTEKTPLKDRNIVEANFHLQAENEEEKKKKKFDQLETEKVLQNVLLIREQESEKKKEIEQIKPKRKMSAESLKSMKEKLKKTMTEKWKNENFRKKMVEAFRKRNKEHNKKISETLKNKWKYDDNYKKKTLEGQRKYTLDRKNKKINKLAEETKIKISKAMKLHWMSRKRLRKTEFNNSPSTIFRKRKKHKKVWEDIYSIILNQNNEDVNSYQTLNNLSVNLDAMCK